MLARKVGSQIAAQHALPQHFAAMRRCGPAGGRFSRDEQVAFVDREPPLTGNARVVFAPPVAFGPQDLRLVTEHEVWLKRETRPRRVPVDLRRFSPFSAAFRVFFRNVSAKVLWPMDL
jgi:hypothetical protein